MIYRIVDPNFVDLCRTVCITVASRADAHSPPRDSLLRLEQQLGEAGGSERNGPAAA